MYRVNLNENYFLGNNEKKNIKVVPEEKQILDSENPNHLGHLVEAAINQYKIEGVTSFRVTKDGGKVQIWKD